ncbi:cysteine-rich CWC family protein [Vibrio scophthalmi]|uniref:cysteine-rich CWC family protein n=1 Tax=Vibrio scophthalmi TaxID=45658 RepID=UPI0009F69550|nr:cysteine-rich CWC family protein [Vibrio scophthalmi]
MKSPCIAACKNNAGICSGCHRTMEEISQWRHFDETQQQVIMDHLSGSQTTHDCPTCAKPTHCDIAAGKTDCWCFTIEKRDLSNTVKQSQCLCRQCLSEHPVA